MKRRVRLVVIATLTALLVATTFLGGIEMGLWLDERYQERRFERARWLCPLAINRDRTVTPMCSPTPGW